MAVTARVRIVALLVLVTAALVACDPALPQGNGTTPTVQTSVTVPPQWHVSPTNGACPSSYTDPTNPAVHSTFTGADWNTLVNFLLGTQTTLQGIEFVFPAGCYYLGSTMNIDFAKPFSNVILDGSNKGAVIQQAWLPALDSVDAIMSTVQSATTLLAIQNFTIRGSAPANVSTLAYPARSDNDLGINALSGSQVTISGNDVGQTWSDPIYVGLVSKVTVSGNTIHQSGRNGLAVANVSDATVTGNHVANVALTGIDIEPNPPSTIPAQRILVNSNVIEGVDDSGWNSTPGNGAMVNISALAPVSDVTISSNSSTAGQLNIVLQGSQPITHVKIDDNTTGGTVGFINVMTGSDVNVTNNSINNSAALWGHLSFSAGTCGTQLGNVVQTGSQSTLFDVLQAPTAC